MYPRLKWMPLLLLLASVWSCKREHPAVEPATKSLQEIRGLVAEQNYRKLGFESLDEIARMTLGEPIPVYFVGLETLRKFNPDDDPNALLTDPHEMIYPVLVDGQARCSLGLKSSGGEWQVRTFGRPRISRALAKMRDAQAASGNLSQADYFAVEISSMYLVFIGHRAGGNLLLTYVHDDADLGFETGQTAPASEVFAKISKTASDYQGPLPPL